MAFEVAYNRRFIRLSERFLRRHPELRPHLARALRGLQSEPFPAQLRVHPLTGRLAGLHAASVTSSYRVVFRVRTAGKRIELMDIGSHEEVYG